MKMAEVVGQNSPHDPAFLQWFAGSKVTNRDGSPKIVYHGTAQANFREFDLSKGRTAEAYFTDSIEAASGYGTVIQAYLRITNPATFDFRGHYWNDYNPSDGDYALYKNGILVKEKGFFDSEIEAEWEADPGEIADHAPEAETTNSLAALAKTQGHDGCIFKQVRDNSDQLDFNEPHTVYCVFLPTQIKRVA